MEFSPRPKLFTFTLDAFRQTQFCSGSGSSQESDIFAAFLGTSSHSHHRLHIIGKSTHDLLCLCFESQSCHNGPDILYPKIMFFRIRQ